MLRGHGVAKSTYDGHLGPEFIAASSKPSCLPTSSCFQGVVEAIQHPLAENLTDSVRRMLLAMLPEADTTPLAHTVPVDQ